MHSRCITFFLVLLSGLTIAAAAGENKTTKNTVFKKWQTQNNGCAFYCFLQLKPNEFMYANEYKNLSCTHLVYGFATVSPSYRVVPSNGVDIKSHNYLSNYARLNYLKTVSNIDNILIGVMIHGPATFLGSSLGRAAVADDMVDLIKRNRFDGLFFVFNSMYINDPMLPLFFETLKTIAVEKKLENIQIALTVSGRVFPHIKRQIPELLKVVDTFYLQADDVPSVEIPRRAIALDPLTTSKHVPADDTIAGAVRSYTKAGIPHDRLIVGLSAWARVYVPGRFSSGKPFHGESVQSVGEPGEFTRRRDGRLAYYEVCRIMDGSRVEKDPLSKTSSFVDGDGQWYFFAQPESEDLKAKIAWVAKNELGGIGLASLVSDDQGNTCGQGKFPMHASIAKNFKCHPKKAKRGNTACTRFCFLRGGKNFSFANMNPELCSHIVLSSAELQITGTINIPKNLTKIIEEFDDWEAHNKPYLMLALGVNQPREIWRLALNQQRRRETIIESIKQTVLRYGFNGLVVSWTENSLENGGDTKLLNTLLADLRKIYTRDFTIIASVTPHSTFGQRYDIKELNRTVDYVLVEGYKYHSYKKIFTGHHSPLFMNHELLVDSKMTIEGVMNDWISRGMPRRKLVVGLSAEGMAMVFSDFRSDGYDDDFTIGSPADGTRVFPPANYFRAPGEAFAGPLSQVDVCQLESHNDTRLSYIEEIGTPFLSRGEQFAAYDNARSMRLKAIWTSLQKFGGIGIDAIEMDDPNGECPGKEPFPLLRALANAQVCNNCDQLDADVPENTTAMCHVPFQVVCNYRLPDMGDSMDVDPEHLPLEKCTEVVVREVQLNAFGEVQHISGKAKDYFNRLLKVTKKKDNLKIIVAMDIEPSLQILREDFERISLNIWMFVYKNTLNGIELHFDDEMLSSANKTELNHWIDTLNEAFIRLSFAARYICPVTLSVSIPAWRTNWADLYDANVLNKMHHVFMQPQPATTNASQLLSPLFYPPEHAGFASVDSAVNAWVAAGLRRHNIIIDIPAFGMSQKLAFTNEPVKDVGSATTGDISYMPYRDVCKKLSVRGTDRRTIYDSVATYAITPTLDWVSYETQETVAYKVKYAIREKLGGVAVDASNDDDVTNVCKQGAYPLLSAINRNKCIRKQMKL